MIKKIKKKLINRIRLNYYADKFFYYRYLKVKFDFSKPFILIYNMGKVGSTSIYESLNNNSSNFNLIHIHRLNKNYLTKREYFIKKEVYNRKKYSRHLYTELLWKPLWVNRILTSIKKPIYIITLVREPIARNISLFFQWIDFEETKDFYFFKSRNKSYPFEITTRKDDLSALMDVFLNIFSHNSHEEWLQEELKNVFQIDLLNEPFDKEKGFSIIKSDKIKLLNLKLEMLDFTFEESIEVFLNEKTKMLKANEASNKLVKSVYNKFRSQIQFPKDYVDNLYSSKYVQHFYTKDEIEAFRSKWNIKN